MKKNKLLKGLNIFFTGLGLLVTALIVFVLLTNYRAASTFAYVVTLVETQSLFDLNSTQFISGAGSGIVDALKDPYSKYLDPTTWNELKERIEAKFGGIGVYVLQDASNRLKIVAPMEGTPAYKVGIKNGDIIIKINDESTANMTQDTAVQMMRGDPGTQLNLVVYRDSDKQEHEFNIIREIINIPSVQSETVKDHPNIGYVRLNQFTSQSYTEMLNNLTTLINEKKVKGLILDIRNNGGGEFESSINIASIFLSGKDVVSSVDAKGNKEVRQALPGNTVTMPLVVLVNGDSASAAEILAGALQDNKRAVLVGEKTYGKGLVQTVFPLPDGGALKLTTQKYFTPQGNDINKIGIVPDFKVSNDPNSDKDKQLEQAVSVMAEELARAS
ncbi:MAG: S41 family peptidase [Syntrophomonadaceae bacterium]